MTSTDLIILLSLVLAVAYLGGCVAFVAIADRYLGRVLGARHVVLLILAWPWFMFKHVIALQREREALEVEIEKMHAEQSGDVPHFMREQAS